MQLKKLIEKLKQYFKKKNYAQHNRMAFKEL